MAGGVAEIATCAGAMWVTVHTAEKLYGSMGRPRISIFSMEAMMVHYDSKNGAGALTSCGEPITEDLHTVDWFDRGQVNCPGCLLMLAKVEALFTELFLPDDPWAIEPSSKHRAT